MTFGSRVRARRRELNITQMTLADCVGRSQATVCKWEKGQREPCLADLEALAKFLQTTLEWLITGSGAAGTISKTEIAPAPVVAGRGRGTEGEASMQAKSTSVYERVAWLGYKDERLVAIELSGFHAGETVAGWESRGYRVEQVSNAEAKARWRREVQEALAP